MMSVEAIRDLARAIVAEELTKREKEARERLPYRCVHNLRHPLDERKTLGGDPNPHYNRLDRPRKLPVIGLCMLGAESPEAWPGTICEEPLDAKRCPDFTPFQSKREVWDEFLTQLADPSWVRANRPDLATLLLVLGEEPPKVPWWRRLLYFLRPHRLEVVLPPFDPALLLPEPPRDG